MVYKHCSIFSDEVIKMGEWRQNNYDKPLGAPCYSCKETDCKHNYVRHR